MQLSDNANGDVVADAVRIVPVAPLVLYWDPSGNPSSLGGSGIWSPGSSVWYEPHQRAGHALGGRRQAVFSGTGTVTISGTVVPSSIIVTSGNPTITSGTINFSSPNTTVEIDGGTTTIGATITGTGGLFKTSAGTLIVTAANTFSGGTTVSAGNLQIGSGGTSGMIAGNVTNNATLTFNRADTVAFAGNISGSGSLVQLGGGSLTLSGQNTYGGTTTVSGGTLVASGGAAIPTPA